ncbi:hypothetical protein SSX86_000520 [Deinandra increscens subsp. villosa]|uniref:Glycosyltransferase N-terminal domain-containing protein n=1 Tax=Deinandra increscens subsp. villosa TaxID=3103831 RepID=A0AAP0DY23_9ASTR
MDSKHGKKPHAMCIPLPLQGHINPMLKLAKILHSKGFLITFINTEFNHQRLVRSRGAEAVRGLPSFRFETIPDGLPPPQNLDATQDVPSLAKAIEENFLGPFRTLVTKVSSYSPVTCIVSDMLMGFSHAAASEFGIPVFLLWTSGPGSLLCFDHYPNLLEKGLMPLKDSSYLVNGYLDTVIDTIPAMDGIRLKNIPPFIRGVKIMILHLVAFKSVLTKVSACYSPVTCIVADFLMGFTLLAAEELGIPEVLFWTSGAGSLICYDQYPNLIQKGLMPLKDLSYLANGYLDTVVDCIPTMPGIRLKDIPPFVRIVNPGDEFMVGFWYKELYRARSATGIIFNTFDALDCDVLGTLSLTLPFCYGIGPLHLLENTIVDKSLESIKSNLWKEDPQCLKWAQTLYSTIYTDSEDDIYTRLKSLDSQIEFIEIQEEYVKDEQKNLKCEVLRSQEEVKRIQSLPLLIG